MTQPVRKTVTVYIAGVCKEDSGSGGWGCILMYGGHAKELSESMTGTTLRRMELMAAISAIGALKESCNVLLYSEQPDMVHELHEKLSGPQGGGWLIPAPSGDQDLWMILLLQSRKHHIRPELIPHPLDDEHRKRCFELASNALEDCIARNTPRES